MLITRMRGNERIDRFSKIMKYMESNTDIYGCDSPLYLSTDDQTKTIIALMGPVYETFSARNCLTILLRLDALMSEDAATYDEGAISI